MRGRPFQPGHPGGPGRPKGRTAEFDVKAAAREWCPLAIERLGHFLSSDKPGVSMQAAQILLDRGFGRPEQRADVTTTNKFVIAPQTMQLDEWLARRGQPLLPKPNGNGKDIDHE